LIVLHGHYRAVDIFHTACHVRFYIAKLGSYGCLQGLLFLSFPFRELRFYVLGFLFHPKVLFADFQALTPVFAASVA
jgi:hypothetical protein